MAETVKNVVPETKRTKNDVGTKSYDVGKKTATFSFSNGKSLVCDIGKLPSEMQTRIALHGIGARVGDAFAAAAREAKDAGTDVATAALTMATDCWAQLVAGKWTERTSSGSVKFLDLIEPLMAVAAKNNKPTTREKLIANLKDKTATELSAIRRNPDVAKAAADIAAKAPKPESDSLAGLF